MSPSWRLLINSDPRPSIKKLKLLETSPARLTEQRKPDKRVNSRGKEVFRTTLIRSVLAARRVKNKLSRQSKRPRLILKRFKRLQLIKKKS